ncbi:hypothetical protein J4405_05040 [Candidatus Woesearchaeota archaeon]|nr:hypothetical protein [Candidatus Woesearchaeota archaeon]
MSLNGINVGGHRRRPNVSVGFLVDEETVDFANLRKPVMFRKAIRGPLHHASFAASDFEIKPKRRYDVIETKPEMDLTDNNLPTNAEIIAAVAETPGMTITDNHKRVGLRVVEYFGLPCEYTLDCSGRCKGIRGVSDLVTCPYDK